MVMVDFFRRSRAGSHDAWRKSRFVGAVIVLTAVLAACGGDEEAAESQAPLPTGTGSALLSWTPPLQNSDGTALLNLTGYRIYWGTSPGNYSKSVTIGANLSSYVIEQLAPARYYFVATAISPMGESAYSNEVTKLVN
jgi:hypothetical protein